jgi:hypothetical protein
MRACGLRRALIGAWFVGMAAQWLLVSPSAHIGLLDLTWDELSPTFHLTVDRVLVAGIPRQCVMVSPEPAEIESDGRRKVRAGDEMQVTAFHPSSP